MSSPDDVMAGAPAAGLLVVRHRQSTWNADRRWTGQADPPLSAHGEAEATALGDLLAPLGFAEIVTSDLDRARQTGALIAARMPAATVAVDPRLREIDIPLWAGRTKAEIQAQPGDDYARWRAGIPVPPAGSEPWAAFESRVLEGLTEAATRGGRVVVVAHSGVLRAVRVALGFPDKVSRSKGVWVRHAGDGLVAGPVHRLTAAVDSPTLE